MTYTGGCFGGMMSGVYANPFSWLVQILVIVLLGLAIVWLWKQINKGNKKKSK